MKAKLFFTTIPILLLAAGLLFVFTACSPRQHDQPAGGDVEYYTCPMHPSVRKHDPNDKCPICKMDLVPVMKRTGGSATGATNSAPDGSVGAGHTHGATGAGQPQSSGAHLAEFVVPAHRQQQIGVTYATALRRELRRPIRAVGVVAYDKQRQWDFVSRVDGYIQKLEISSRGELVEKDQPLLTIYSPELMTTQREFLDLVRLRERAVESGSTTAIESAERLLEAARRRLLLWNITEDQIKGLETERRGQDTLTLVSPFKGVVQDLRATQGQRVTVGERLVNVTDLSVVWIWAEFYQDEIAFLKQGMPVTLTSSTYSDERFQGTIAVVDPFINELTRTARVRIDVENPHLKLRPDMYVNVLVEAELGQTLTIPVQAVMPTGERNLVFVDKGEGKLEPRFVQLGRSAGDLYPVKSGLEEGERIVASANFLIDAEAKVQGAVRTW